MEARMIQFRPIVDERGKLISLEGLINVPFAIKRVFYICNIPGRAVRGGHSHKVCHQLLVAVNGWCTVSVNGAFFGYLASPDCGLYVPPGNEVTMRDFGNDCILLVLASEYYDPEDYVQNTVSRLEAPALAEAVAG